MVLDEENLEIYPSTKLYRSRPSEIYLDNVLRKCKMNFAMRGCDTIRVLVTGAIQVCLFTL